jgi:NAD(P)H-dependent FMN reductase
MPMPRIAVIIGSTRDKRFGAKPAQWIFELANSRKELDVELVDIRDFNLPFFNEAATNLWVPSEDENAQKWQKKIGEFDGYIFVTAEYNRSIPASLKNALDQAYVEWNRKPAAILGYGATAGARAVEHLRSIAIELQMVPLRNAVHIGGSEFMKVHPMGDNEPISAIEDAILSSANKMLDELEWWADVTMAGRRKDSGKKAA